MTGLITIVGVIAFVVGGIWGNRIAMSVGVGLIILGAFVNL